MPVTHKPPALAVPLQNCDDKNYEEQIVPLSACLFLSVIFIFKVLNMTIEFVKKSECTCNRL